MPSSTEAESVSVAVGAAELRSETAAAPPPIVNAQTIGVQLIIWNRVVWRANGSNEKGYGGPHPHNDHIHVEITNEGTDGYVVIDAVQFL